MSEMGAFIDALLARLTVEEKIGQLNLINPGGEQQTGSLINTDVDNKLRRGLIGAMFGTPSMDYRRRAQEIATSETAAKIPLLFASDVIHGYRTALPLPIALSCTWDMALIEASAYLAAVEARADGIDLTFAPMVDVTRDPRWGRVAEGSGEDPLLGARIASAMVRGFQGASDGAELANPDRMMACVKHFVAYGAAEAGREYSGVSIGPEELHEIQLPPFKAAIDAGAGALMPSFNTVNGRPVTANKTLLTDLLRQQWTFNGVVLTDYTAINELQQHGLGDLPTVSALALNAGVDMDMVGEGFVSTLRQSLDQGRVDQRAIDQACRRVLEAKWKLGLFADPFRFLDSARAERVILNQDHRRQARAMAARSCVLLKNSNSLLPLAKSGTIALIGPLADDQKNMQGTWAVSTDYQHSVSVRQGIEQLLGDSITLLHAEGAPIVDDPAIAERLNVFGEIAPVNTRPLDEMIEEAVAVARRADTVVAVVGEAKEHSGECASRTELNLPECQRRLLAALKATGKPVVAVIMAGRPLSLSWEAEHMDAIVYAWFGGTEAGSGLADVLFGEINPNAKLTMSFPVNVGQVPIYHAQLPTGRPLSKPDVFEKFKSCYLDVGNRPLYPFGYGLSYTTFRYGALSANKTVLHGDEDTLEVSLNIANTGQRFGEDIVQLYIADPVAGKSRPVLELKDFQRVGLEPGAEKTLTFSVTTASLEFVMADTVLAATRDWEAGEFVVYVGPHSEQLDALRVRWDKH